MSESQEKIGTMALTIFALNGQFLTIAEQLALPVGLTATRWQVLGAVLTQPLTQAEIARRMGITRQSVRRTALQLIDDGMLCAIPNPSHRTAMLLQPTEKGYAAIDRIKPRYAAFAEKLGAALGTERTHAFMQTLIDLRTVLDALVPPETDVPISGV